MGQVCCCADDRTLKIKGTTPSKVIRANQVPSKKDIKEPKQKSNAGAVIAAAEAVRVESETIDAQSDNESSAGKKKEEPLAQSYHFYYVPLHPVVGPGSVSYEESEVCAALDFMGKFLEQFSNQQVVLLTLPIEELEMFFSSLDSFLTLIKEKTGKLFAPILLQRSLFCPMDEFMVGLHRIDQIDLKLP